MVCKLIEDLKKTEQLPTAPGVAMRIVELNQCEEVDIDELAEVLSQDPALVAKLLKTANSSMFGLPREISSVRQAVMTLGLRSVNLLALSFSVLGVSSGGSPDAFDYRRYWTETTATALGARVLAERVNRHLRDEAFLAGLLAGFGRLILAECATDRYMPVLEKWRESTQLLTEIEKQELGVTSVQVGGELLKTWGLPEVVCDAIAIHDDPSAAPDADSKTIHLAQLLHISSICGRLLSGGHLEAGVDTLTEFGGRYFDFDGAACSELLQEIQQQLPDAAKALDLETNDLGTLIGIATQAAQLLVRESLALNEQVHVVTSENQALEAEKDDLTLKASTDPLTGLRNRGFFDEALEEEALRCKNSGSTLGVLVIDLDHFKAVNDTYGHQMGDEVLREAAQAIAEAVEEKDWPCRYGGEEFAVICPDVTATELEARGDGIRAALSKLEFTTKHGPLQVTASVGASICECGKCLESCTELFEAADQELYRAKLDGRNCTRISSFN